MIWYVDGEELRKLLLSMEDFDILFVNDHMFQCIEDDLFRVESLDPIKIHHCPWIGVMLESFPDRYRIEWP